MRFEQAEAPLGHIRGSGEDGTTGSGLLKALQLAVTIRA
jgi:hypothetical protein